MSDQGIPIPPANLEFLIVSLKTQVELHLGLLHFGEEKDRPEPDFRIARHSIDLLAVLQEKTRGNTSLEEQRLLDNSLTELRFRFVQAMERQKTVEKQEETAAKTDQPAASAAEAAGGGTEGEGQAGT